MSDVDAFDAEPDDEMPIPADALTVRDPRVPVTLTDLAALRGAAVEVLDARVLILETARKRAIRMTHPPDWVLFRSPDGVITGYLQDAGCDRVRDILGVEVYRVSTPEKVPSSDGSSFTYIVTGCGRSRLTLQTVETMEGGRSSDGDFARGVTGANLELLVRKAARANLDGNITRELTGLKAVPLQELVSAWEGTNKSADHCRKGRGFGTQDQRHGMAATDLENVTPPTCTICKDAQGRPLPLKIRKGSNGRGPWWGCVNYAKHEHDRSMNVDAAEWAAKQRGASSSSKAADDNAKLDAEIARKEGLREPGAEG